ncbi:hypothetical protein [Polaribacter sp. MED152]|uniref:hypothetical protein n=1 Tax=Polaribacter sp. MED152 TaxID=313598 RepID=UPI000068C7D1|nr:hypothetical protein [Polaribacter sp. MED152]EAQ42507.1 hypothetical protein MED152_07295 [Polaribacter sp. MED152]
MIDEILIENRICPKPMIWNEIYKLMCQELREKNIPKPLILAGWNFTTDREKKNRFMEHLNLIDLKSENKIKTFVLSINEKDWYKG